MTSPEPSEPRRARAHTWGEMSMRSNTQAYSIYRVFGLGSNPRFYKLTGSMRAVS